MFGIDYYFISGAKNKISRFYLILSLKHDRLKPKMIENVSLWNSLYTIQCLKNKSKNLHICISKFTAK